MKTKLYFAYGVDLNLKTMSAICPAAQKGPTCQVRNFHLVFRGDGGAGVLSIEPQTGGRVPGVLWKITPSDEEALDRLHGCPARYRKRRVSVDTADGMMLATAYVLLPGFTPSAPSNRYLSSIRMGYAHCALPGTALKQALAEFSDMPGSAAHPWCPLERKPCPYAQDDPDAWTAFVCGAPSEDLMLCR